MKIFLGYLEKLPKPLLMLGLAGALGLAWTRYEAVAGDVAELREIQARVAAVLEAQQRLEERGEKRLERLEGLHLAAPTRTPGDSD